MRWLGRCALGFLLYAGLACATPCREGDTPDAVRDFERDYERCAVQAQRRLGNVDVGDYRSCMRVRGWCEAPEHASVCARSRFAVAAPPPATQMSGRGRRPSETMIRASSSSSTGFVRWASNPASLVRRRSAPAPYPVIATST
jgi:hypothetical protein